VRFSSGICVVSVVGSELSVEGRGQRVTTLSRRSQKGVARSRSSARKIDRDALVANRQLRQRSRSRIFKVSGTRLPRRHRHSSKTQRKKMINTYLYVAYLKKETYRTLR